MKGKEKRKVKPLNSIVGFSAVEKKTDYTLQKDLYVREEKITFTQITHVQVFTLV